MLNRLEQGATMVADGIEQKMWSGSFYHPALDAADGVAWEFAWSDFYPSATAQTFPIMHGLIATDSQRAQDLYAGFCNAYAWETMDIPDKFYWGSNVYVAAMMGDVERVSTYMTLYERVMNRHLFPLYNADAAKVSMAAYLMTQMGE